MPQASLMVTFLQYLSSETLLPQPVFCCKTRCPEHPCGGLPSCAHSSVVPTPSSSWLDTFHWITEWLSASPIVIQGSRCLYPISSLQRTSWLVGTVGNCNQRKRDSVMCSSGASLVVQMVENMPAMQETRVQTLAQEEPWEKEMATHSSILAWRMPWPEGLLSYSPWARKESGHNCAANTHTMCPFVNKTHSTRCMYLEMCKQQLRSSDPHI